MVPFPFNDRNAVKRRPALVLSHGAFNQWAVASITHAEQSAWPENYPIKDLETAGLPTEFVVRLKLFTQDHRLVIRKAGVPGLSDQKKMRLACKGLLAI